MISENIKALVAYRIEQAEESLTASKVLLDQDLIRPSVNLDPTTACFMLSLLFLPYERKRPQGMGVRSLFLTGNS